VPEQGHPRRRAVGAAHGRRDTSAVFVRIPTTEAEKLDRAARALDTSKRDLIAGLVARYVDPGSAEKLDALRALGDSARPRRVIIEAAADPLAVGQHSFRPSDPPEVLTAAQVADLLQADEKTVMALAEAGDLPGRRLGEHWRFSRRAVLDWLSRPEEDAG
jgi:excisionase family DNA binding protein